VRILGYRPPERSVDVTNLLGAMHVHHLKATNLISGQLLARAGARLLCPPHRRVW
jgi:hypothetical protein